MIRLIAALDRAGGIAVDAGIPWTLPGDRVYFRAQTSTGLILMGRATYEEFAAPLHDRENFVLTTRPDQLRDGFRAVTDLDQFHLEHGAEDVWVIGGAAVYAAAIHDADELLLTQVFGDFRCTTFFPPYRDEFVRASQSEEHEDGGVAYRFEVWRPRPPE
jgi:dihydrofolate reductase